MNPYYEQDGITIYHGDCAEIIPSLSYDVVITSPPYNKALRIDGNWIGLTPKASKAGRFHDGYGVHDDAMDFVEYDAWQTEVLGMLWDGLPDTGAIFYNHKPRIMNLSLWTPMSLAPERLNLRQIITWVTGAGVCLVPTAFSPSYEWILLFARSDFRLTGGRSQSSIGDAWVIQPEKSGYHPAPFPLAIPARILDCAAGIVLDPFMGSGTTLRAAKDVGRRAIGVDVDERYCEMTAKRLAQGVLNLV